MSNVVSLPLIALAGAPNSGKTSLFNALTGSRQKVANYAGVTVESKEGECVTPSGLKVRILDLPGTFSLDAHSPDEAITRDVLLRRMGDVPPPDLVIAVADATSLERSLNLVLELQETGVPVLLALNMMDLARNRGLDLDLGLLSKELGGVPIVATVAVKGSGISELVQLVEDRYRSSKPVAAFHVHEIALLPSDIKRRFQRIDEILKLSARRLAGPSLWTERLDRVLLHPLWGPLALAGVLLVLFQSIFNWAGPLQDGLEGLVSSLGLWVENFVPVGAMRDLLVSGVIAGVGAVVVFLPQILILFFFILLLEDSGYMARAAFVMDRLMAKVGLHGRAFIPLLSSFACAIPGIMATRTIENKRDRLTTMIVAPLMTCSARLPVYALLIAAFIPNREVLALGLRLQGLVLFFLYLAGVLGALGLAYALKRTVLKGPVAPLVLELPSYKWPSLRNVFLGLVDRSKAFLKRAGTVILSLSIVLWFLVTYPKTTEISGIQDSYAGRLGQWMEPAFKPVGFDWKISLALIPGFAAREVMVSALGTVYSVEQNQDGDSELVKHLSSTWTLATALSLLVWFIFAPQCIATLAVIRRETASWGWTFFVLFLLTGMAYGASFVTYRLTLWFT